MTTRIAVALVVSLGLAGPLLAQPGDGAPAELPAQPGVVLGTPVSPGLPGPAFPAGPGEIPPPPPGDEAPAGGTFWGTADYVQGWIGSTHLPALATTSPPGTPRATAGALGMPTTTVLFGNQEVNGSSRPGGMVVLGYHLDGVPSYGVEASLFVLSDSTARFAATSNGSTILARPFIDAVAGTSIAELVAFPGVSRGTIEASARSHTFYCATLDVSERFWCSEYITMDALAGYRYMHYADDLQVGQQLIPLTAPFAAGTQLLTSDQFLATNDFNGGEVGLRADLTVDEFGVEVVGKVAAGNVHQQVTVQGGTATVTAAGTTLANGGLLALPSNIGTISNSDWVYASDLSVTFNWQPTEYLRVHVGYSFLFWSHVARASDQVDLVINRTQFPPAAAVATGGPILPQFPGERGDFWINAIHVGADFRY